jgi:hypothetical protein
VVVPYYFACEDLKDDWQSMVQEFKEKEKQQTQSKNTGSTKKSAPPQRPAASAIKIPVTPKIVVADLAEVLCLAEGLPSFIETHLAARAGTSDQAGTGVDGGKSRMGAGMSSKGKVAVPPKIVPSLPLSLVPPIAFIPPYREINMLRRMYRNQPKEFSRAKFLTS